MGGKERGEIIRHDAGSVDPVIQAAGTDRGGADIPQRDVMRPQPLQPHLIGQIGEGAEQFPQDPPEPVGLVTIVLSLAQRLLARQ